MFDDWIFLIYKWFSKLDLLDLNPMISGFLIFMIRRSSEMMGGIAGGKGGGRKGGGMFGGVMESTAKLINPSEIKVQFK